ncbi:conserved phage C-terminal domain-containing protein [[Clostridium] innocuum]|nr:conserved phage C-terminal domain-containing protein [[Clostridium] innocuum]
MAEKKRYYYLKLEEDYFTNKVQKALRKLPSGAEMCLCYLKMQLLGLRTNGVLIYDGIYETFEQEISEEISEDENIVRLTLGMLRKWNLIADESENQIYMQEMQGRFGSTSDVAQRVAKHREKQKLLQCNTAVTKSNAIKEIDIEIDIDKEKDILSDSCESDDVPHGKEDAEIDDIPYKQIIDYLNEKAGTQYRYKTPKTKEKIKARYNEGFSFNDFKTVIDKKCAEWLMNADMCKYLRPETLFGTKFEGYLNQPMNVKHEAKQLPEWWDNQESVTNETIDEIALDKELEELVNSL